MREYQANGEPMMHERERHRLILRAVGEHPVVTVAQLVDMLDVSEATIRRDIAALDEDNKLRRIRGGAEAINPVTSKQLLGRPFFVTKTLNVAQKAAIAERAVEMCEPGDSIIIHGGSTTYQMAPLLKSKKMQVLTNSFPLADYLIEHSENSVVVPGGTIYREQNIILSPFESDVIHNFYASKAFVGAQGINSMGLMESDPMIIQSEQRLIAQAEKLVVMIDSTKFSQRSNMFLCKLDNIDTLITDDGIGDEDRAMLERAGIKLVVVQAREQEDLNTASA
jgi:DeoR family ulaG and ulaABCDEF operon transcriptional repressor